MGKELWCGWLCKVNFHFLRYRPSLNTLQDGNGFVSHHFARRSTLLNNFSEVMLCDFTSGVTVVSWANLVSRGAGQPLTRECLSIASLD